MSLTFAEQFIMVVLAVALAVFLIAGILFLIRLNQILRQVRSIVKKAEAIADQAQHVGEFFSNAASSASVVKLVSNIINSVKPTKTKEKES